MKNKIYLSIILGLFLISFTSAMDCDGTYLGTFEINSNIELRQTCDSCTYVTLNSITYPNSTLLSVNTNMTKVGIDYNYSFRTNLAGNYYYSVFGDKDGAIASETFCFEVTYSGLELSTGSSIFYAILIFLMILLLVGTLYGTGKLPAMNEKDEEGRIMSVKWGKYLRAPLYFVAWMLFIAILYISSNLAFAYLGEQLFANVLFVLFKICFGITPAIVVIWFVWFFVRFFQDKKFQTLLNRGIFPQKGRK